MFAAILTHLFLPSLVCQWLDGFNCCYFVYAHTSIYAGIIYVRKKAHRLKWAFFESRFIKTLCYAALYKWLATINFGANLSLAIILLFPVPEFYE